jgi:hypothetical protein
MRSWSSFFSLVGDEAGEAVCSTVESSVTASSFGVGCSSAGGGGTLWSEISSNLILKALEPIKRKILQILIKTPNQIVLTCQWSKIIFLDWLVISLQPHLVRRLET